MSELSPMGPLYYQWQSLIQQRDQYITLAFGMAVFLVLAYLALLRCERNGLSRHVRYVYVIGMGTLEALWLTINLF